MGEVHHAHDPEDQGEADAHERIAAAHDEAVDEVLDELGDHGRRHTGRDRSEKDGRAPGGAPAPSRIEPEITAYLTAASSQSLLLGVMATTEYLPSFTCVTMMLQ